MHLMYIVVSYEEHGDDDAAGHVGTGGPARHQEVDDQHGGHAGVPELFVGVFRVEVVDRLLPGSVEQGGQLAVGPVPVDADRSVAALHPVLGHVVDVELDVHLRVRLRAVGGRADVAVVGVRVPALRVHAGYRGTT